VSLFACEEAFSCGEAQKILIAKSAKQSKNREGSKAQSTQSRNKSECEG
jgi:hypothetical protein